MCQHRGWMVLDYGSGSGAECGSHLPASNVPGKASKFLTRAHGEADSSRHTASRPAQMRLPAETAWRLLPIAAVPRHPARFASSLRLIR